MLRVRGNADRRKGSRRILCGIASDIRHIYIADIHGELVELLQTVVITSNDDEVSEDALELLSSYEWPPFEILENNMDKVSEQCKPYVLYVINMGKEE